MEIKQSGLIIKEPSPSDYVAGVFTAIPFQARLPDGNWKGYLPSTEKQHGLFFDSMSCTTFSALNSVESEANFLIKELILTPDQRTALAALGFIDDNGNFNCSDRFTAIMSGTTQEGNDFKSVAESIRRDGLLPEKDLPFGGLTFDQFHNKSLITEEMKVKAKKILEILNFQYEWVFFDNDPRLEGQELETTHKNLKVAPIQIAIPIPAHHATMLYNMVDFAYYEVFDSYAPYLFQDPWEAPIHFAMKIFVSPNVETPYVFTKDLYLTKRDPEVAELQKRLNKDPDTEVAKSGPGSLGNETVVFGQLTHIALVKYQNKHGIKPASGYLGPLTRKVLNGTESVERPPQKSKLDAWCDAIKEHEGWFIPGQNASYPRGSVSYRCNNPGNLKYVGQRRATGRTPGTNFCIFSTYDDGYAELKDLLVRAATGQSKYYKPEMTILEFYHVYAPSSDNNTPSSYAAFIAKRLGVDVSTQIKSLL